MKNRIPAIYCIMPGIALAAPDVSKTFAQPVTTNQNLLWYEQPADKWVQALPIGNGRLGGVIPV
jgi:alpha-L-fucosidase 2